jgi:hypothetical protein
MRNDKASREIRQLLAAALYREPWNVECLRYGMERRGWPFHKVEGAAKSLGVESFEYEGQTYWRLPDNVLPFVPRHCHDAVYVSRRYRHSGGNAA